MVLDPPSLRAGHKRSKVMHPQIMPDVNDPNNYCRSCEENYSGKYNYRTHLKKVHKMVLDRLSQETPIFPDENDPNNHCRSCEENYSAKHGYHAHLKKIHKMLLDPLPRVGRNRANIIHPQILPDMNDANNYCRSCEMKYSGKYNYRQHLILVHRMAFDSLRQIRQRKMTYPRVLLDVTDPNNYCRICEKKNMLKDVIMFTI